jgi:hypothetical protein
VQPLDVLRERRVHGAQRHPSDGEPGAERSRHGERHHARAKRASAKHLVVSIGDSL